jgi:hypothetical protein
MQLRPYALALFLAGSSTLLSAQCAPDPAQARKDIDKLETILDKAYETNTIDKVAQYLAPDYVDVGVSGRVRNKEQLIAARSSATAKEKMQWKVKSKNVNISGNTAVVTYVASLQGSDENGKTLDGTHAYVRVYSYNNGAWKVVSTTSGPFYK